jgi:hypothetical protein
LFQPSTSALPEPVWAGSGDADSDGAASGFLAGSGFEPGNGAPGLTAGAELDFTPSPGFAGAVLLLGVGHGAA